VIFDHNASKLFIPASNLKIITSACALKTLGPRYRFHTDFLTSSKMRLGGVLDGDLIIRGFGDPTLADLASLRLWKSVPDDDKAYALPHGIETPLESIVKKLWSLGLREISGDIVIDDSYFRDERVANGWTMDDEPWFYASQTGAVSLNENIITVTVSPGETRGDKAIVNLSPPTSYVKVLNSTTSGASTLLSLAFTRRRAQNEIIVSGNLPRKHKPVIKFMTVEDPGLYFGHVLRYTLRNSGIRVTGSVERRQSADHAHLILRNRSVPLSRIVYYMNKTSDNFYAEQLLKTIGAVVKKQGSWNSGLKAEKNILANLGTKGPYRLADGSGLSRYNLVTPRLLTTVLRAMRKNSVFVNSLPIAGRDTGYGTLAKRMKATPAARNLRAKTGTFEGVSTLSGYVKSRDQRLVVFSIMTNASVGNLARERALQDGIGIALASNSVKQLSLALHDKMRTLTLDQS
jgi:PBP4 family serine-type D-alanyl-D-alanine carboxypeptidase